MTRDVELLRLWLRIAVVVASIGATSFPLVYAFSPWRRSPLGRVMMLLGVSLAFAMDLTVLFMFWRPANILVMFWVNAIIISGIAVSTFSLTWLVWRMNYSKRRKVNIVQFSSPVYDKLKAVAQIWLPAAGTLYFALAQIWGLPNAEEVSGTVLAVDTFLGVVLGLSSASYKNSGAAYDGTMVITPDEATGSTNLRMKSVDVEALAHKSEITFRVVQSPSE